MHIPRFTLVYSRVTREMLILRDGVEVGRHASMITAYRDKLDREFAAAKAARQEYRPARAKRRREVQA